MACGRSPVRARLGPPRKENFVRQNFPRGSCVIRRRRILRNTLLSKVHSKRIFNLKKIYFAGKINLQNFHVKPR